MTRALRFTLCALLGACGSEIVPAGEDAAVAACEDTAVPAADAAVEHRDSGTAEADASGPCTDSCPVAHGVTWGCEKRFALGTNWAWKNFGGDFGGISCWNQKGVSQDAAAFQADLTAMKAKGVNVIRWWMFPRFFTDSVTFDGNGVPTGIGGTLAADLAKALELADQADVYLVLTLFSFDSFTPTRDEYGLHVPGLQPIVIDAAKRKQLLDKLVAPVATAVEASPHKARMIAWDLINEPEWAMTGANPYGGQGFEPMAGLDTVDHAQMETFLQALAATLRAHSKAQVTLGSAAIKWATAWKHIGVDFYQLHYYDWVYEWFPYTSTTLQAAGLTDKPVVMGEFPNKGLSAIASKGLPAKTASQLALDLWNAGYGGALSWAHNDPAFPWNQVDLQTFGDAHSCQTRF